MPDAPRAAPAEILRFRREWRELSSLTHERDIRDIISLFTIELGGAWAPGSKRELAAVGRAIAPADRE